jgi:hypothetical protein
MADEQIHADDPQQQAREFEQQAAQPQIGLLREFVYFLLHNKKWWLTPIILVLLAVALLVWLGSTGAPFIYPL